MISGIIKVEVSVISRSRRLRLITLTEILIIPDITKTESNNCFIIHCFEENNDKRIIAVITVYFLTLKNVRLSDKQIFTVFLKQSSAEELNAFLNKVSLNLYLQVISQFLAGSMKRIEKPFLLSLQNRRISGASVIHERAREARALTRSARHEIRALIPFSALHEIILALRFALVLAFRARALVLLRLSAWPRLFKGWITLSTG